MLDYLEQLHESLPPASDLLAPRLVGLSGFARSGKDTAAAHLVAHHGYRRFGIADPLRSILFQTSQPIARLVTIHGWDEAKSLPDVRQALQEIGDVLRFELGPDVLLNRIFDVVDDPSTTSPIVIADVRTTDEVNAIWKRGGKVLRIERPGVGPANAHATETVAPYDIRIDNDGTVAQLWRRIDHALWAL